MQIENPIWLIGAGPMAIEYAKVLRAQQRTFVAIGRGESSARTFAAATGFAPALGGLDQYLSGHEGKEPVVAIVAVGVPELASTTRSLLKFGVRRILVEKPAGLTSGDVERTADLAGRTQTPVLVAYNRRFYASVRRGREIIAEDGGVSSFAFEFTEWSGQISASSIAPVVKQNWLLANSSHVLDMAFFLGGTPERISAFTTGSLPWHPSGSAYAGAGITKAGALFSYSANWDAPGRWGVEIMTKKRRLIYRPLESLKVQQRDSVQIVDEPIENRLDVDFKPGLYLLVDAFLNSGASDGLLTIGEHLDMVRVYDMIQTGNWRQT